MALFTENMTKEEKQQKALTIMRMGSPLSDDERDEITALLFLDGLTRNEYNSAANKKARFQKLLEEFDAAIKSYKKQG